MVPSSEAQPEPSSRAPVTTWRQGSFLTPDAFEKLGFEGRTDGSELAVVLTHDCDCVRDPATEPLVEIIFGKVISDPDQNKTNGKSVRTLHLRATKNGASVTLSFEINARVFVSKVDLLRFEPDANMVLSENDRYVLTRWFASRYTRSALPDELVRRLKPIKEILEKFGKRNPHAILGIFVDHDPLGEIQDPLELYEVSIAVVYLSNEIGAEETAQKIAKEFNRQFERHFKRIETDDLGLLWDGIELRNCEAVADAAFSLRSALDYKLYHLEYLSLRERPIASHVV